MGASDFWKKLLFQIWVLYTLKHEDMPKKVSLDVDGFSPPYYFCHKKRRTSN